MMSYKRLLEQSRPGVLATDLAACQAYGISDAALSTIAAPTLIVAGANDLLTPVKAAKALATRLSNATMVLLPDAGHSMMQEAPAKVVEALKGFLKP